MKKHPTLAEIKEFMPQSVRDRNPHLFVEQEKKKPKYNNRKVEIDGITFDSKKESNRYLQLRMMQQVGQITELAWQVEFQLLDAIGRDGIKYIADFTYQKAGNLVVEDVKGDATRKLQTYRNKKKMMFEKLGITVVEV